MFARVLKTSLLVIICASAAVFVASYTSYARLRIDNSQADDLAESLERAVLQSSTIDITTVTAFAWDEMYVIKPYTSREEIWRQVGTRWTTRKTYAGYLWDMSSFGRHPLDDDSLQKLVFLRGGKVVCDLTLTRDKADFTTNTNGPIRADQAAFTVERQRDNYPVLKLTPSRTLR